MLLLHMALGTAFVEHFLWVALALEERGSERRGTDDDS